MNKLLTIAELADECNAIWNKVCIEDGLDPEAAMIRLCYAHGPEREEYLHRLYAKAAFTKQPNLLPTAEKNEKEKP